MATATASRGNSNLILDILRAFLRSIDKLPPRSRPGLIGVVVFMILSVATMKLLAGSSAEIVILVLGSAVALIVIGTGRRDWFSVAYVVALLGFCCFLLNHIKAGAPPLAGKVVLPDSTTSSASATVSGNVRYTGTNEPVAGAFVDVDGYGARSDTTSESGWFEITVPQWLVKQRRDSVTLAIRTRARTDVVSRPIVEAPFRIALAPAAAAPAAPAAPVDGAAPNAARARASLTGSMQRSRGLPPARPLQRQEKIETRLVLDSVKILHDGSASDTYWRFDITVNNRHAITIPQRAYDRRPGKNLLHLAGEVTVALPQSSPHLLLHIRGLRDAFIGVHQVNGQADVDGASLQPERPAQGTVVVRGDNANNGDFIFYYTLVRRGAPNG
ncbi:MAG TPA: hypothetical protein VM890_15800 [Longimicrobium sp.]|nr:hypothetical protein [Longimicrobium sp.]